MIENRNVKPGEGEMLIPSALDLRSSEPAFLYSALEGPRYAVGWGKVTPFERRLAEQRARHEKGMARLCVFARAAGPEQETRAIEWAARQFDHDALDVATARLAEGRTLDVEGRWSDVPKPYRDALVEAVKQLDRAGVFPPGAELEISAPTVAPEPGQVWRLHGNEVVILRPPTRTDVAFVAARAPTGAEVATSVPNLQHYGRLVGFELADGRRVMVGETWAQHPSSGAPPIHREVTEIRVGGMVRMRCFDGLHVLIAPENFKTLGLRKVGGQCAVASKAIPRHGLAVHGKPLAPGDAVCLVDQPDPRDNGVWLAQSGAWTRPHHADTFGAKKPGESEVWSAPINTSTGTDLDRAAVPYGMPRERVRQVLGFFLDFDVPHPGETTEAERENVRAWVRAYGGVYDGTGIDRAVRESISAAFNLREPPRPDWLTAGVIIEREHRGHRQIERVDGVSAEQVRLTGQAEAIPMGIFLRVWKPALLAPAPDPKAERAEQRAQIDRLLAADARRCPAFAKARRAAVLATAERYTLSGKEMGPENALILLDYFVEYEQRRPATGRDLTAYLARLDRDSMRNEYQAIVIYERARGLSAVIPARKGALDASTDPEFFGDPLRTGPMAVLW